MSRTQSDRRSTRVLLTRALILLAALVLHGMLGLFKFQDPQADELEYHNIARSIVAHGTFGLPDGPPDSTIQPTARLLVTLATAVQRGTHRPGARL